MAKVPLPGCSSAAPVVRTRIRSTAWIRRSQVKGQVNQISARRKLLEAWAEANVPDIGIEDILQLCTQGRRCARNLELVAHAGINNRDLVRVHSVVLARGYSAEIRRAEIDRPGRQMRQGIDGIGLNNVVGLPERRGADALRRKIQSRDLGVIY